MMNMKTVRYTDESRESLNELDGLNKGWRFNGDNCDMGKFSSYDLGRNDWK